MSSDIARLVKLTDQPNKFNKIAVLFRNAVCRIPVDICTFCGRYQDFTFCRVVPIKPNDTNSMQSRKNTQLLRSL